MEGLQQTVRQFLDMPVLTMQAPGSSYRVIADHVNQLCHTITAYERQGYSRETLATLLSSLREAHARSPFIQRLQDWPKGYPGDYESIEYLLEGVNQAQQGTLEYYFEAYALEAPIAQQHRNKLAHQGQLILNVLSRHPARHKKILSLACNSGWDLRKIQHLVTDADATFFLNDHDPEALQYVLGKLSRIVSKCRMVPGNYIRAVKQLKQEAPFDLITTGGICDYLNDRQMEFLIKNTYQDLLASGGTLYLTNVAKGNPYRPWMEYMGSWELLERNEEDLLRLCRSTGCPIDNIRIITEESGLTLLVEIKKH